MNFIPIKSMDNIFSHNEKITTTEINHVFSYCKMLLNEISKEINKDAKKDINNLNDKKVEYIKKLIIEHMYIIYYAFKCIGILKLTSKQQFIDILDKKIEKYLLDFFSNNNNLNLFNALKKKEKNNNLNTKEKDEEIYFFENMINKCEEYQKCSNLKKEIDKYSEEIYEKLEAEDKNFKDSSFKKVARNIPELKDVEILDRHTYYSLQRKIKDPMVRKNLEKIYFAKSNCCMGLLEKLLLLRTEFANKLNHKSYFEYINKKKNNIPESEIKNLIDDLILKIDTRAKKETDRIKRNLEKDGHNKKVEFHDFIYYYRQMCSDYSFSLKKSLIYLLEYISKHFSLKFEIFEYKHNLWNKNIITYKVNDAENVFLGFFHFDLCNKIISSPISIHLCHNYKDINGSNFYTQIAILSNFGENITHNDIISLAKELGNAIQLLYYKSITGNVNYRDDFFYLTSKIMEYIVWEKNFLLKITANNTNLVEHLLFTRFIDFGNSIKLRCVNAYFDHVIHSSVELISELKKLGRCSGDFFKNLYKQIYNNIFSSQKNFKLNIDDIHPVVILQEINDSEGCIYESILVEIFSYNIYNLIKNGDVKKYLKILEKAGTNSFKKSLNKFVSKLGDNYAFYLQELIGYNEIDTELNMQIKNDNSHNSTDNDGNIFDDKTADQENTFVIDRKLEL